MKFVHDDPDFPDLLDIVAEAGPIRSATMAEKDYWICHALWALEQTPIRFWFKGGTSLSKAFQLIDRFSEDIDLVIETDRICGLPAVGSWKREEPGPSAVRKKFWEALCPILGVPGCEIRLDQDHDATFRNVGYLIEFPGVRRAIAGHEDEVLRRDVLLEISYGDNARSAVAPSVLRPISSAVHDWLDANRPDQYANNRPNAIDCVHPFVTLLEKLDAITRRYERADDHFVAAAFARHYEDAARIINAEAALPGINCSVEDLAQTMLKAKQIRRIVLADHPALTLADDVRRKQIHIGYDAIRPMYWGPRIPLGEATGIIQEWLRKHAFQ